MYGGMGGLMLILHRLAHHPKHILYIFPLDWATESSNGHLKNIVEIFEVVPKGQKWNHLDRQAHCSWYQEIITEHQRSSEKVMF